MNFILRKYFILLVSQRCSEDLFSLSTHISKCHGEGNHSVMNELQPLLVRSYLLKKSFLMI